MQHFNLSLEGQSMNMQAYSSITSDKVVPLNFKSSANNTFEIKATEFENMDEIQNVYLRDNVTGTYFDLKQNLNLYQKNVNLKNKLKVKGAISISL